MTDNPTPPSRPVPDDLHWGISYLREDIQDLRNQMREDIQELHNQRREDIQDLRNQIGIVHHRIDETNKRIDETNKRMDAHFIWIMTTLVAITGILIAVIKL